MSFDKNHLLQIRDKLNSVSPSFCLAKWMHVTLHLHSGHTHSCYHPSPRPVPEDLLKKDPSVLHNTPHKAQVRKEMLEGKRPSECDFCWSIEDLGGISDRVNISSSGHGFELIDKKDHNQKINPSYVEVSFSNNCNFKCSYCSPGASSKWAKEIIEKGGYSVREIATNYVPPQFLEEENPYVDAWWKWFPDVYPGLKYLRITGGEPLLSESTFRLMDYIIDKPNKDLNFSVNTNMGVPTRLIEKFITKFNSIIEQNNLKDFSVFTSLDTWGPQAEYTRNGLNLKLFQDNVEFFLKSCPKAKLSFMVTFQILSLPKFNQFLEYILDLKKRFNTPEFDRIDYSIDKLVRPSHQSILTLPGEYNYFMDNILVFMKSRVGHTPFDLSFKQLERFENIYKWLIQNQEHETVKADREDFYKFFKQHDLNRDTDFQKTFPEFHEFWETCKRTASVSKYEFSHDQIGYKTKVWLKKFKDLINTPAIRYLEVGIGEGNSLFWMLENVLTAESSEVIAIDPFDLFVPDSVFVEKKFNYNLSKSGLERKIKVIKDYSNNQYEKLEANSFDIILIDGHHDAPQVIADLNGSISLLKAGGFLTIDDYLWESHAPHLTSPKVSIDEWLLKHPELEVIYKDYFILARKRNV